MRNAFFRALLEVAETDPRVELVIGDLGFGVVEEFVERFPDRFTNAGVAEQNMTGLAVGMAMAGAVVFTYSIGNFPTLRCLEHIRNDAAYHDANVKVVTIGGGLAYGALGFSHHATEDLAILRAIPGLMVAAPGDPFETTAVTRALVAHDGPAYLRLGKAGEPAVHAAEPDIPVGAVYSLRKGDDVLLLSIGGMLPTAVEVAERLAGQGIEVHVVSVPWLRPFDDAFLRRRAAEVALVVTLEEHSVVGGLGGATAEVLAEEEDAAPLLRLGLPSTFTSIVGDQSYLLAHYGLDPATVVTRIRERLHSRKRAAPTRLSS
jgi:transketolase